MKVDVTKHEFTQRNLLLKQLINLGVGGEEFLHLPCFSLRIH